MTGTLTNPLRFSIPNQKCFNLHALFTKQISIKPDLEKRFFDLTFIF